MWYTRRINNYAYLCESNGCQIIVESVKNNYDFSLITCRVDDGNYNYNLWFMNELAYKLGDAILTFKKTVPMSLCIISYSDVYTSMKVLKDMTYNTCACNEKDYNELMDPSDYTDDELYEFIREHKRGTGWLVRKHIAKCAFSMVI